MNSLRRTVIHTTVGALEVMNFHKFLTKIPKKYVNTDEKYVEYSICIEIPHPLGLLECDAELELPTYVKKQAPFLESGKEMRRIFVSQLKTGVKLRVGIIRLAEELAMESAIVSDGQPDFLVFVDGFWMAAQVSDFRLIINEVNNTRALLCLRDDRMRAYKIYSKKETEEILKADSEEIDKILNNL
jgi:hypothetical protein